MKRTALFLISLISFLFTLPAIAAPIKLPWETAALGLNPAVTQVRLYGFNGAIAATYETAWPEAGAGTANYTPLTVAMSTPYCASSDNTADVSPSGTGARTISVTGLNTSFARFTETVALNGQTSVNLATANVLVIDGLEVLTAGSGGLNAGIVQCGTGANTAGDPAVVHAYLPVSSITSVTGSGNKSSSFIYGVAANKTLFCRDITAATTFATAASGGIVAIDGWTNLGLMKRYYEQRYHTTGSNPFIDPDYIKFPEKTIIVGRIAGPTGSNVGPADLSADCLLIDNGYFNSPEIVF